MSFGILEAAELCEGRVLTPANIIFPVWLSLSVPLSLHEKMMMAANRNKQMDSFVFILFLRQS